AIRLPTIESSCQQARDERDRQRERSRDLELQGEAPDEEKGRRDGSRHDQTGERREPWTRGERPRLRHWTRGSLTRSDGSHNYELSNGDPCDRKRPAQADEERLQRQRRIDVELGEIAPGLAGELGRLLRTGEALERGVLVQLVGVVAVDCRLGSRREGDEIAVPSSDFLQRREQLFALGAPRGAAQPLLHLALRQLEPLEAALGGFPRLLRTRARARDNDFRRCCGLELRRQGGRAGQAPPPPA